MSFLVEIKELEPEEAWQTVGEFVELATHHGLHPGESRIRYAFSGLRPAANWR